MSTSENGPLSRKRGGGRKNGAFIYSLSGEVERTCSGIFYLFIYLYLFVCAEFIQVLVGFVTYPKRKVGNVNLDSHSGIPTAAQGLDPASVVSKISASFLHTQRG